MSELDSIKLTGEVADRLDYEVPMLQTSKGQRADLHRIVLVVLDVIAASGFIELEHPTPPE